MEDAQNIGFVIGIVWTSVFALVIALVMFYLYYRTTVLKSEKEKQLEKFRAVSDAEEIQKERIANSLHDNVGAYMTVIIQNIDQNIKDFHSNKFKIENLKKDKAIVLQCIEDLKEIALELIPKVLANYGLLSALKIFASKTMSASTIIQIENQSEFDLDFPFIKADEVHIYRLCQEILNNLRKHDQLQELKIQISDEKNIMRIRFNHDGKGVTNYEIQKYAEISFGFGLKSIQTRLLFLKGSINYSKSEGRSLIEISIPHKKND